MDQAFGVEIIMQLQILVLSWSFRQTTFKQRFYFSFCISKSKSMLSSYHLVHLIFVFFVFGLLLYVVVYVD